MLLKPATPLTVLLLAAFALLLLSTLSTPVIKQVPLATFKNVDFGVFGYCRGDVCTPARVGYDTSNIFGTEDSDGVDFNLPSSARNSLSSILIVHPVAAFLALICLIMAAASHFHSPSHSPRYLLALLILLLPTVLVSLLAFLVDILLFVPHLQWGGWIVLASTIILVACGVVTCAMRRTLVSRKARKKRIAENAEMSGAGFYARQNAESAALAKAESPPPMSTDTNAPLLVGPNQPSFTSAPTFATYDSATTTTEDELRKLHSRTPSNRVPQGEGEMDQFGTASRPTRPGYNGPRDEYGNPIPPTMPGTYRTDPGMMRSNSDPRLNNQYSDGSLGSRRGPSPQSYGVAGQPPRNRGYPPPRGGYAPGAPYGGRGRGPPTNGRGGSMRSMRGGPPPRNMGPGRGPPPGYPPGRDDGYDTYAAVPRRPSDRVSPNFSTPYNLRNPSASQPNLPEVEEPGHSFEMVPQSSEPNLRVRNEYLEGQRDSHNQSIPSPTSVYSSEPYVPPRSAWSNNRAMASSQPRDINTNPTQHMRSGSGDHYFEDVEPRFAEVPTAGGSGGSGSAVPSALMAGRPAGEIPPQSSSLNIPGEQPMGEPPRSPAVSDISHTSHFTSISERPINPHWQPPSPPPVPSNLRSAPQPRVQDMVLQGNPDFELPVAAGRGGPRYGRAGRMAPVIDSKSGGRYPNATM
ncbi:SUR7/PalI family-domain-containing protein [Talaromyces proteolyticus]|uniref:SUR7/PalI family-domain-containing protein n=1 Tax=Talaromyces proteolyticus TaxID=1131652 RepID=A0AAD4KYV3_9EURO|nr:SUR7/PalI family-domain-containing protein [Talaromyces proteolyticus]KAH8703507.1 SUR7/PalI family-domain-containing protein [Talaromyces proteolyticus]